MDNLNHLNLIVHEAVNTIHSRIKEESDLLSSISQRINNAYEKTALIGANTKKSTTIYSSTDYPQKAQSPVDKPLMHRSNNPSTCHRSKYSLSLKQRNERPDNVNTVQLLNSISNCTKPMESLKENDKFPDWVDSIGDCMVFGTNVNAYNATSKQSFRHRRRRRKKNDKHKNGKALNAAPPSICDRNSTLRFDRRMYGDHIQYRPVLDRSNMPKFNVDFDLFGGHDMTLKVVEDIKWQNDGMNNAFIPSDILNVHGIDFEFSDDVEPPQFEKNEVSKVILQQNKCEVVVNNDAMHQKVEEKNESQDIDAIKDEDISMKEDNEQNIDDREQLYVDDNESEGKENDISVQPVIFDVNSQSNALPKNAKAANVEKKEEKTHVMKRPFDANALQAAKLQLAKIDPARKEMESENVQKEDNKEADGFQGVIFDAISKIRQYHTDSDDDDDQSESDSFYA